MLSHRLTKFIPLSGAPHRPESSPDAPATMERPAIRSRRTHAITLVEVMVSMTLMATVMLSFIGTFIQSRRATEASVLHAAATSMIYGIIEQIKELDYDSLLPNYELDPQEPTGTKARPYIRVRINQGTPIWISVKHTVKSTAAAPTTPKGPTTTPSPGASYVGVGADGSDAIENWIGSIPLSTVTGTTSQQINLDLWVWIDEIGNTGTWSAEATQPVPDSTDVKKVTIVYTYQYLDGSTTRTVRDREVFVRTAYDQ